MKKEKDSILEAYEKMLVERSGPYSGKWSKQYIGKKAGPIFLDHRDDINDHDKKMIQFEKKNHYKVMSNLEKGVLDALAKMDKQQGLWEKFLKEKGL